MTPFNAGGACCNFSRKLLGERYLKWLIPQISILKTAARPARREWEHIINHTAAPGIGWWRLSLIYRGHVQYVPRLWTYYWNRFCSIEYIISVAACSNRSNGCVVGLVLIASSRHRRQIDKISQSMDVVLAVLSLVGTVHVVAQLISKWYDIQWRK